MQVSAMPKKARTAEERAATKVFGASLRGLMEDRGDTPAGLMDILNCSYDSVIKYLNGNREPAILSLIILANHYQVTLDRLICGPGGKPKTMRKATLTDSGVIAFRHRPDKTPRKSKA